ncbi:MAG: Bug family tripartite tricarboxylate transporter substrate binding protein [Hyphomicrobiaceae bacterium]
MRNSRLPPGALLALSAYLLPMPVTMAKDDVADFFRGKTVQLIVPSTMGGSVGLYGRLAAEHLGKHIPGNPTVIPQSMPGAGGLTAVRYITGVAAKDGTIIGEVLGPALLVPLLKPKSYDPHEIKWLGSLTARPGTVVVWHTAPAKTLADAKKVELKMGSSGAGSGNFWIPTLSNAVLGTKFKLVLGYPGGNEINLAMERREVDGRFNFWSGWTTVKRDWLKQKKLTFLFRTGPKTAGMPEVPSMTELTGGDDRKLAEIVTAPDEVGVGFYISSRVPADRAAALIKAFEATANDKDLRAAADKLNAPIDPVKADVVQRVVDSIYSAPDHIVNRLKTIVSP